MAEQRPFPDPDGQATAVAFASSYILAVQQREPAAISFVDLRTGTLRARLDLKQPSRFDTGHEMFHLRAGAGVACASCHAEAGDDSHVWSFQGIGARRTQNLRGGILGTEPFHWNGDMRDFSMLMQEVFVGRMSGFMPQNDQTDALAHWIDKQPALQTQAHDTTAAARGKQLFESDAVGCVGCHNGQHFSNNQAADVGTGAVLQVPSLLGVSFRTPLMHDGCAKTLADRFGSCGGGDKHGHTSQLSANQIDDLTAYLETL
jgi:cytochrome c